MKNIAAFLLMVFSLPVSLAALDFGLLVDQGARVGGTEKTAFSYEAVFIPRFSFLLGDSSDQQFGEGIITAGMTLGTEEEEFYCIPELLRTEFSWRFGTAKITAGRMLYSAPFAPAAEGLFDGFQFLYDNQMGTFSAGAWYTGLLYKKKTNITMTMEDTQDYHGKLDYDDFFGTYFASRRMLAALGWEYPAIADLVSARLAVITQFDLNNRTENDTNEKLYLHSQYLTAKAGMSFGQFMFELGGALELAEYSAKAGSGFNIGLAGELEVFWTAPTPFLSLLSFTGYFSSGTMESGPLAAFTPVTSKPYGAILEAAPSGISMLSLDYTARLHKTLSAGFTFAYFIRSDLGTYVQYPVDMDNDDEYFLGSEYFARLIWSPVSDIQLNLGGGVFLPVTGNAAPEREPQWRVQLTALLALY